MKVSVIIPTVNAGNTVVPLIDALNRQSNRPIEIIIVDSSSDDDTVESAKALGAEVIVVKREDFNHGETRNLAASYARGDVVVFMTQDALPANENTLMSLLECLKTPSIAASFARQICRPLANPIESFCRGFNYPDQPVIKTIASLKELGIKTFFFSNVCSAVNRNIFLETGGFRKVIMNEDMMFAADLIKAGYAVSYTPEAIVIHSHNYGPLSQFRRNFDIGVSIKENGILSYANPQGEGRKFIVNGLRFFLKAGKPLWAGIFIVDSFVRYAGFMLGSRYDQLPVRLQQAFSMHPTYFK